MCDTKRGVIAVGDHNHDFEIICKGFKVWAAKQRLPNHDDLDTTHKIFKNWLAKPRLLNHDDLDTTCKGFKNWLAKQRLPNHDDLDTTCKGFKNWLAKPRLPNHDDLDTKRKGFKNWFAKQDLPYNAWSLYYHAAVSGIFGEAIELLIGGYCSWFRIPEPSPKSHFLSLCGGYKPLVESFIARGYHERSWNIALMMGCNSMIARVMNRIRGKEDIRTSLVAGFGYGVMISLVTGMRGPGVISVGAVCALFSAGVYKAGIKIIVPY